jgi:hypothetical protein
MKYSLRSLMTFSIRDLALVTVIVAVIVGWWVDSSTRIQRMSKDVERMSKEVGLWKGRAESSKKLIENTSGFEVEWSESTSKPFRPVKNSPAIPSSPARLFPLARMPESEAPAPNPPKP